MGHQVIVGGGGVAAGGGLDYNVFASNSKFDDWRTLALRLKSQASLTLVDISPHRGYS
jgi:hypothetical protein